MKSRIRQWLDAPRGVEGNPSTTMQIYQQTVTEERRSAQAVAFNALMGVGGSKP